MTCSFDGGVAEDCSLPLVLDIVRFGTDEHVVIVTATDEFGQTASVSLIFRLSGTLSHCHLYDITGVLISPLPLAPALNISCETLVDGLTFLYLCEANNNISSISCFINNDTPTDCELERTFHLAAILLDSNCSEWCGM